VPARRVPTPGLSGLARDITICRVWACAVAQALTCAALPYRPVVTTVDDGFAYFGSGAGIYDFSNFCEAPFELWGFSWPSSEHCYQAAYRCEKESWARFAAGGDLSTLESGLPLVYKAGEVAKKLKWWGARSTKKAMVGIVPKMAVRPDRAAQLGLKLRKWSDDPRDLVEIRALFTEILLAKYRANPPMAEKLVATGSKLLIEFDRGAERKALGGNPPLWTGLMKDGEVHGRNLMGELMMEVRAVLTEEQPRS